jgi:hypothetical protein
MLGEAFLEIQLSWLPLFKLASDIFFIFNHVTIAKENKYKYCDQKSLCMFEMQLIF